MILKTIGYFLLELLFFVVANALGSFVTWAANGFKSSYVSEYKKVTRNKTILCIIALIVLDAIFVYVVYLR